MNQAKMMAQNLLMYGDAPFHERVATVKSNKKSGKYSRLNTHMEHYIHAVNTGASPEVLHCQLRDLITEAIRVDITLARLLEVLAGNRVSDGDTQSFINNVSKHYGSAESQNEQKTTKEEIHVIQTLMRRYSDTIMNNVILKNDFNQLLACIHTMDSRTCEEYEKILSHLIAEVSETATDNQRMANESPLNIKENSKASTYLQDILKLKEELNQYHLKYHEIQNGNQIADH